MNQLDLGKHACIVQIFDFEYLEIHKNHVTVNEWYTELGLVVLKSLVSHPWNIPNIFYESAKLKIWTCELCTFLQIRSHAYSYTSGYINYVHCTYTLKNKWVIFPNRKNNVF